MKTYFFNALFFVGIVYSISAQKIDFSCYLASSGGLHTSTPSVAEKNGNIFVAGGTREGLKVMCISPDFPATLKYAEPDKTWMNCIWKFDLNKN